MSVHFTAPVWKIRGLTPMQKLILLKIADNANDEGICWPSLSTIADDCGCSSRTVSRAISHFNDIKLLSHDRRFNKSNVYKFNKDTMSSLNSNEDTMSIGEDTVSSLMRTPCLVNEDTGVSLTVKNHNRTVKEPQSDNVFFGIDLSTIRQTTLDGKKRTLEQLKQIAQLQSQGHYVD